MKITDSALIRTTLAGSGPDQQRFYDMFTVCLAMVPSPEDAPPFLFIAANFLACLASEADNPDDRCIELMNAFRSDAYSILVELQPDPPTMEAA